MTLSIPAETSHERLDAVLGTQVDDEELAEAGVGVAVAVGVVELAVLLAGIAQADACRPGVVGRVARQQRGAPARHARLLLADAGRELVVLR